MQRVYFLCGRADVCSDHFLTIGYQSLQAAPLNPVKSLKMN